MPVKFNKCYRRPLSLISVYCYITLLIWSLLLWCCHTDKVIFSTTDENAADSLVLHDFCSIHNVLLLLNAANILRHNGGDLKETMTTEAATTI